MMNINKSLDKAYEGKSFKELVDAPVSALEGISAEGGKVLEEKFKIKTIGDLAKFKYAKIAEAIVLLAAQEE
ncbi:hypothetical protein Ccar_02145 [Clostridium carboxidivorans P7]|uniref:Uncharacterized protein n=2 Tax=Clostridium TaxID=1485 RepID=C6PYI9_9CLOT|nr:MULTISPECIES: hypothetical protein [Clostridium]AKA69639.1 hypothetical protein CSCA_2514 [Clostridium scatologenes]AKN29709.1 hypothetical protein Ccar_02145 [Clostridium carboxidivorans P7]EET85708.1 conserved hypothetical protein [Clostridium carboxidivorans P7]EFG89349.1 hypothetical protein CLCAR_0503 [Clostridium carboxidivorans P7]